MKKFLLLFLILMSVTASARGKYDNTDTLVVAQDGTGEFHRIGDAIEVCRAFMEYTKVIYVKNGVYKEKIVVPSWLTNIVIIGQDRDKTIITNADHANMPIPGTDHKMGTFRTYTVKVEGTNITFRNLTIENNAPKLGQAVALHTEGDRLSFVNCRILGNQDTVYTGTPGTRVYFLHCFINGTTDFIFGPSIAWFEDCELQSRADSYVTAASTPRDQTFGYIFSHCRLTAEPGVTKCYLGRPWRAYAYTLFIYSTLGSHIVSEGWHNWPDYHDPAKEGTVRYYEYGNTGPGADRSARVGWSAQLKTEEAAAITTSSVFGDTSWLPAF